MHQKKHGPSRRRLMRLMAPQLSTNHCVHCVSHCQLCWLYFNLVKSLHHKQKGSAQHLAVSPCLLELLSIQDSILGRKLVVTMARDRGDFVLTMLPASDPQPSYYILLLCQAVQSVKCEIAKGCITGNELCLGPESPSSLGVLERFVANGQRLSRCKIRCQWILWQTSQLQ